MKSSPELVVRRYREGDESVIVPFLERHMGWPAGRSHVAGIEHWRWKFLDNPLGFNLVCVALQDGQVVSHSASLPVTMKVGESEVLASQGVDLCTDPSYRGRGLIGKTMEVRNQMKDEHEVLLDFGFPNRAAYHVSLIKQGFVDLGIRMMQHRYIIDEEQFFRKVRFGSIKRIGYDSYLFIKRSLSRQVELTGIAISQEKSFGPEFDDLYRRAAEGFDLMIAREHRYLNWRFGDLRGGDFIVRTARQNGNLLGYMVHRREEREGSLFLNIVDALVDPGQTEVIAVLALDAISLAKGLGIETILCCLPDGHPYAEHLVDIGFLSQLRYTGDRPMSIICFDRGLNATNSNVLERPDLRPHIMLGDTDWV